MICFDASIVVKWLFVEEHSTEAQAMLDSSVDAEDSIIAPPLLFSEVANVVRQRQRRGSLEIDEARTILASLLALPITILSPDALLDRALVLAHEYDLPAIYDAQYVALAELTGATFWTADQRLIRALADRLPFVRSIADWRPDEVDE